MSNIQSDKESAEIMTKNFKKSLSINEHGILTSNNDPEFEKVTNKVIIFDTPEDDDIKIPIYVTMREKFSDLNLFQKIAVIILGLVFVLLFHMLIWWACNWHIAVIFPSIMVLFFSCFSIYTIQCTKMWRQRNTELERDAIERVRRYQQERYQQSQRNSRKSGN